MKKIIISKLFLYRYRFIIGYVVLGTAFMVLLFTLPLFAQNGLSEAEISSATNSYYYNTYDEFDIKSVKMNDYDLDSREIIEP